MLHFDVPKGDILARAERNPHNTYPMRWRIHPSVMAMLAFQDNPGMSKYSSCLFYSRCRIWISAKPMCIAVPPFSSGNSFRAHQPGGRAETPCDRTGMHTAHSPSSSNAALIPTVATGLPQPPLTSLGTQCHCLKKSCPALRLKKLLYHSCRCSHYYMLVLISRYYVDHWDD